MSLKAKIQVFAAAVQSLLTAVIGALLAVEAIEWSDEQTGAVMLVYTAVVGVVVAGAQVFTAPTTPGD